MVEFQSSKLATRVRFPSPAPEALTSTAGAHPRSWKWAPIRLVRGSVPRKPVSCPSWRVDQAPARHARRARSARSVAHSLPGARVRRSGSSYKVILSNPTSAESPRRAGAGVGGRYRRGPGTARSRPRRRDRHLLRSVALRVGRRFTCQSRNVGVPRPRSWDALSLSRIRCPCRNPYLAGLAGLLRWAPAPLTAEPMQQVNSGRGAVRRSSRRSGGRTPRQW